MSSGGGAAGAAVASNGFGSANIAPVVVGPRAPLYTAPTLATLPADGQSLDRAAFTKKVAVRALRIKPQLCKEFMGTFKKVLLNIPRHRNIIDDTVGPQSTTHGGSKGSKAGEEGGEKKKKKDGPKTKLIILCPSITTITDLSPALQEAVTSGGAEMIEHELVLTWDYWNADQLLRASMPMLTEITSSFESIGHIAHLNLRDKQLPFKTLIGQIILDKNKHIKTVVNKLSSIDTTFRFFKMELIAGEDKMETEVKECGCRYKLSFDKVYWNSRLHAEHSRIVDGLKKEDVVADMMAGIGPFAMPAAKFGCRVYANDLNPNSHSALVVNIKLNKVETKVTPSNVCARDFIRKLNRDIASKNPSSSDFTHCVMNLPASAPEFLDVFRGLYLERGEDTRPAELPMIHCYCFSKSDDPKADAKEMCEAVLGSVIPAEDCSVHEVRDVAPKKVMMCVSFKLPHAVAYETAEEREKKQAAAEHPSKKAKLEE